MNRFVAVEELLREYRRPKKFLPISARYRGDCFQLDIRVYSRVKHGDYKVYTNLYRWIVKTCSSYSVENNQSRGTISSCSRYVAE